MTKSMFVSYRRVFNGVKKKCNYYYCDNFGETSGYISHVTYHDAKDITNHTPKHLPRIITQSVLDNMIFNAFCALTVVRVHNSSISGAV